MSLPLSPSTPLKLLEIRLISAQDLPPVSKVLRTYAVAWIHPDQKLTTHIDRQGHNNPTWNYKFAFPLDEKSENSSAALTIQIFNVAWLRDTPIGTATVLISHLKSLRTRRPLALRMCRPTGLLQGIINVGVNVIDNIIPSVDSIERNSKQNGTIPEVINNIIIGPVDSIERNSKQDGTIPEIADNIIPPVDSIQQQNGTIKEVEVENDIVHENMNNLKLQRSRSERTAKDEDFSLIPKNGDDDWPMILNRSNSGWSALQPNGSICSMMQPLPSEVAAALKDGLYSTYGDGYGSSIFDNWTETGDKIEDEHKEMESRKVRWPVDDQLPLMNDCDDRRSSEMNRKKKRERRGGSGGRGGGLLSCFGNAYGFEFSFVCGSNKSVEAEKKNKKMTSKSKSKSIDIGHPGDKLLRRLYI